MRGHLKSPKGLQRSIKGVDYTRNLYARIREGKDQPKATQLSNTAGASQGTGGTHMRAHVAQASLKLAM